MNQNTEWCHKYQVITPIRTAALLGGCGVALGAFGSHGIKHMLEVNGTLEIWKTASTYHLFHSVLLTALSLSPLARTIAFKLLSLGILIFSGSLYTLALTNIKILGAVTPIGGLLLIAGWGSLAFLKQDSASLPQKHE